MTQAVYPVRVSRVHATERRRHPRRHGVKPGGSGRGPWTLDPRDNSLNLLRLVLALVVLVSHSFPMSGREEPSVAGKHLGTWAVVGFFALSGYLITGSRLRSDGARYFMARVARILPGYLVCLVVTGFVFAPIVFAVERGTLDGFLTAPNTPLNYVFGNALIKVHDYSVAGTLADAPLPDVWNGSLWTLYYEFLCYVVIGVAAMIPVVRRKSWPIIAMFAVSVVAQAKVSTLTSYAGGNGEFAQFVDLLPYFLGGAVVYVVKGRCPLRWYLALPALGVALAVVAWETTWGAQLVAPLFAYALLWLASVIPSPQLVQTHDVSYGVYVYAWPVTQMLVLLGSGNHGWQLLVTEIAVVTLVLATLSWLLVERPSKDLAFARPPAAHQPAERSIPRPRVAGRDTTAATGPIRGAVLPLVRVPSGSTQQPVRHAVPMAN